MRHRAVSIGLLGLATMVAPACDKSDSVVIVKVTAATDVGAVFQRVLEHRAQKGVVARQDGPETLGRSDLVGNPPQQRDIDQGVGRIGRRLDQDQRDPALASR